MASRAGGGVDKQLETTIKAAIEAAVSKALTQHSNSGSEDSDSLKDFQLPNRSSSKLVGKKRAAFK